MANYLTELGVRQELLSDGARTELDQNGYVSLGILLSKDQLDAIRNRVRQLIETEGGRAGSELLDSKHIKHPKEEGADRLADLVNKGAVFHPLYTHPKLLTAISHVLGNQIKLSSLNYRAAKPGKGLQKLHVDWEEAVNPGEYKVCNSIWLLDDFFKENGATRVVPGTHLCGRVPTDEMGDPEKAHPEEAIIEAPAGTVFVFNSHVWHGGTTNRTQLPRRAIHSYFCQRDQPQQSDQAYLISDDTKARLTPAARWLLDA